MRFLRRSPMHWIYLTAAILCEVSGTTCMKLSQGFSRPWPTVLMYLFYLLSLNGLNLALRAIDVSVAYAIWAAMGTALVATIGLLWFKEPLGALKVVALCLIVAGVVGLNLSTMWHHEPADGQGKTALGAERLPHALEEQPMWQIDQEHGCIRGADDAASPRHTVAAAGP